MQKVRETFVSTHPYICVIFTKLTSESELLLIRAAERFPLERFFFFFLELLTTSALLTTIRNYPLSLRQMCTFIPYQAMFKPEDTFSCINIHTVTLHFNIYLCRNAHQTPLQFWEQKKCFWIGCLLKNCIKSCIHCGRKTVRIDMNDQVGSWHGPRREGLLQSLTTRAMFTVHLIICPQTCFSEIHVPMGRTPGDSTAPCNLCTAQTGVICTWKRMPA